MMRSEYTHFQFLGATWDLFKEIYMEPKYDPPKKRIPVLVGDLAWSLVGSTISSKRHVPLEIWSFPNGVIDFVKGYSSQSGLKLETHQNLQVFCVGENPTK